MKKSILTSLGVLLLTTVVFAQVHRDTDGNASTSINFVSLAIGLVVGLVIGYLIGARTRKA